jgi:hypothetical protein
MRGKSTSEKFSDQQLYRYGVEGPIQNDPPGQFHRRRITGVNEDQLLTG